MASDGIACLINSFRMSNWSIWIRSRTLGSWLQKMVSVPQNSLPCRLNRGQAIGASLQKIWKSHSIPISRKIDTTNESASVAYSNVRLWKLDTQKEWRNTSWRLWDKGLRKILLVSWTAKKTNEWVLNKAGVKRQLIDTVTARKLAYYGLTLCGNKEVAWRKR